MFASFPSRGHLFPVLPLAQAARAAGHEVVIASGPAVREVIESRGLNFLPVGIDGPQALALYQDHHPERLTLPPEQEALLILSAMFVEFWVPAVMSDLDRMLDWRPDVIVREEGEFAAPLVAAIAGVPCADHSWGPIRPRSQAEATAAALAPVWRGHGMEPDPLAGFYRWLYIDICPPSLQFPGAGDVAVLHRLRPPAGPVPAFDEQLPTWISALGSRPVVYVTLGTVSRYNQDTGFFASAIEGLSDIGADIVVTLGPTGDPSALGPQPSHVHVERFVPQAAVLPHCCAVVTNGGSGSVMGALAHGAPVLCVPAASPSQLRNADAVVRAGAGRSIGHSEATAARIRSEVSALVETSSYLHAARNIAGEIASMPPVAEGVTLLERLAEERRPLSA